MSSTGSNVCSLLTSIRNSPTDALAPARSTFKPPSYAHAVIGASVGSTMRPSVDRNPRDAFAYALTDDDTRPMSPSLGENTPCVALTADESFGVERVFSTSYRAPTSARMRSVSSNDDWMNGAPDACMPATFAAVESRRRVVVK